MASSFGALVWICFFKFVVLLIFFESHFDRIQVRCFIMSRFIRLLECKLRSFMQFIKIHLERGSFSIISNVEKNKHHWFLSLKYFYDSGWYKMMTSEEEGFKFYSFPVLG